MVNVQYANAMAETLHYLKGIRKEDIDKIPKSFMKFLEENASKEYICNFDYHIPLKELNLLDETKGIIGTICLNYWCNTQEQKQAYLKRLNENEIKFQEELREKYSYDNLFKKRENEITNVVEQEKTTQMAMVEYKHETFWSRIISKIKKIFVR